jgi:hypothetical protein
MRTRSEQSNISGNVITLKPNANLAVEKAMRLLEGLPAREDEIRAKVLRQLHGSPLPTPDYIQVLFHQAGSDDSVRADCKAWPTN